MQASATAPALTAGPDLLYALEAPNEQNGTPAGAAPDSPLVQQQLDTPPVTAAGTVQPVEFISLWNLFVLFLSIGMRAFGGPVAQVIPWGA